MSFEMTADPKVVENDITKPTLVPLKISSLDELFAEVTEESENTKKETNPLIEAIESVQQPEVTEFDEIWQSLIFDDRSGIEFSNSHLKPTGRILNAGTPWASYEHVECNSAGTGQIQNSEHPNVSTANENFSQNCLTAPNEFHFPDDEVSKFNNEKTTALGNMTENILVNEITLDTTTLFSNEQQPAQKLDQNATVHLTSPKASPTNAEDEQIQVTRNEMQIQQKVRILVEKAVGQNCNQLTLKEAKELTENYEVVKLQRKTKFKDLRYRCQFCLVLHDEVSSFHNKPDLCSHYRAHLRYREKCNVCGKCFRRQQALAAHMRKAH